MTPELFVDTSAWVALAVDFDAAHQRATEFSQAHGRDFRWITSNWVIAETATLLRSRTSHAHALKFKRAVGASGRLEVVTVAEQEEARAWAIFTDYADKSFSVVDCTSFAVMESRGAGAAFAFDRHFRQYGFVVLPQ